MSPKPYGKSRGFQTSVYLNDDALDALDDLIDYYKESSGSKMIIRLIHNAHRELPEAAKG